MLVKHVCYLLVELAKIEKNEEGKNEEGIFIAEAHSLSQHKHVAALSFLQGKKFNFEISFGEMVSGKQRLETAVSFFMVLGTNAGQNRFQSLRVPPVNKTI